MTTEKPRHDGEWVSAPREPTEDMLKAGIHAFQHARWVSGADCYYDWEAFYRAALAASPAPAALGTQEGERASLHAKLELAETEISAAHEVEIENRATLASHARTIEALREALTNAVGALAYCERDVLSPNDVMRPKVEATLAAARRALKEHPNVL